MPLTKYRQLITPWGMHACSQGPALYSTQPSPLGRDETGKPDAGIGSPFQDSRRKPWLPSGLARRVTIKVKRQIAMTKRVWGFWKQVHTNLLPLSLKIESSVSGRCWPCKPSQYQQLANNGANFLSRASPRNRDNHGQNDQPCELWARHSKAIHGA